MYIIIKTYTPHNSKGKKLKTGIQRKKTLYSDVRSQVCERTMGSSNQISVPELYILS